MSDCSELPPSKKPRQSDDDDEVIDLTTSDVSSTDTTTAKLLLVLQKLKTFPEEDSVFAWNIWIVPLMRVMGHLHNIDYSQKEKVHVFYCSVVDENDCVCTDRDVISSGLDSLISEF